MGWDDTDPFFEPKNPYGVKVFPDVNYVGKLMFSVDWLKRFFWRFFLLANIPGVCAEVRRRTLERT